MSKPSSIGHLFFEACTKYDKSNAALVKRNGAYHPISHRFFRQRVEHFGRGLLAMGLPADFHFAILAETRFEWAVVDLGILTAGGVVVPVYHTLPAEQIAFILNNSDSTGVICSNFEQVQKIMEIRDEVHGLKHVFVMEEHPDLPAEVKTIKQIETLGAEEDNAYAYEMRWRDRKPDHLFTIIYTSGTTGYPKGVMLTHNNMIANVHSCEALMPLSVDDICLSHLPLSHVFERMAGYYWMITKGVTIAYAEDIKTVPENIAEVCPTTLISVPRLYEKIYAKILANAEAGGFIKRKIFNWAMAIGKKANPYFNFGKHLPGFLAKQWNLAEKLVFSKVKAKTGGRLKYMISGGAPLSREIAEAFQGMGLVMLEGYGLTETSPVLTFNRLGFNKPGTVGPPVPDVEIKIAEDGEIMARGPNIMKGYYKSPEATEQVFSDGWFLTGDIGVMDADQFLRITDRKKDLIVTSGGKNIAPQPIENAVKLAPLVEQVVVIGDKRNFVSALVVPPWETVAQWAPTKGWPTDPQVLVKDPVFIKAIEEQVEKRMEGFAHYEKIKKIAILPGLLTIEGGELTPSLKVKRKVVNEKYKEIIESIYQD